MSERATRTMLTLNETDQLIEALEACEALRDESQRALVLRRLPDQVFTRVKHSAITRVQIAHLVHECARHPGGLARLREAVRWLEGPSTPMQRLDRVYARHHRRMHPVFLTFQAHRRAAADELARLLHAEEVALCIDYWNLAPDDPWNRAIEVALDECPTCIVLIGAQEPERHLHETMRMNLAARAETGALRAIPVLLPGAQPDAIPLIRGVMVLQVSSENLLSGHWRAVDDQAWFKHELVRLNMPEYPAWAESYLAHGPVRL